MWDRERGCRMRRKSKTNIAGTLASQLDAPAVTRQTLRSPPHPCMLASSPLCFCFSRLNTCYSSWRTTSSICWSWFACQQRARQCQEILFPKKLCALDNDYPASTPIPCGFGWNCDFAGKSDPFMTQDTNNPATCKITGPWSCVLGTRHSCNVCHSISLKQGLPLLPFSAEANRDTTCLSALEDLVPPWAGRFSTVFLERPELLLLVLFLVERQTCKAAKTNQGGEVRSRMESVDRCNKFCARVDRTSTESDRVTEKAPRLSMWREETMFESLFEAWPRGWQRPGSYRCFTCVLHGQSLVWYQEGYLWVFEELKTEVNMWHLVLVSTGKVVLL